MEAEVGRIPCCVTGSLACGLKPKERINSLSFSSICARLCTATSYRNACQVMNRLFHRPAGHAFKMMTIADGMERLGNSLDSLAGSISASVLSGIGFDPDTGLPRPGTEIPETVSSPCREDTDEPAALFGSQILSFNECREACDQISNQGLINATECDPSKCVYISVDDVGVRHQKDTRKDGGRKDGKVIENTVIHVRTTEGSHILTALGMDKAFRYLLAFLFSNRLLEDRHVIFFSDGAQNIRKAIETYFSFCPYEHYLDWYHLEKRMTELLSMALKGNKADRHDIRYLLDRKLWVGNFDAAAAYISSLDKKFIKNASKLKEAIEYLDRKKPFACCYALRSILGYHNSSNPAEKANDLVVANRQKHNGMSWSGDGSSSLALITASIKNGELDSFLRDHTLSFSMSQESNEVTAA